MLNWTDIQEDSFSKRYFKKLEKLENFNSVVQASMDIFSKNMSGDFINISFHIEPSLIYLYPCSESDLFEEVDNKVTIQVAPFFEYFESIESKYYKDEEFYQEAHTKILKDFYGLFLNGAKEILQSSGMKFQFYEYGWDDKEGVMLNKLDMSN
ncbi:hypothetical protein [Aliikangiella maris]|uniref:DUF4303 domain-containing protein n=2 Tax=Aliikangiella maris TaxID=3162458 RepID=A0ABV2BZP4_9GAMM